MKVLAWIVGIVVAISLLTAGIVVLLDVTEPRSTSGVSQVGEGVVKLPAGETLVLVHTVGKYNYDWYVTYSNSYLRLTTSNWPFGDTIKTVTLSSNAKTSIDFGWGEESLSAMNMGNNVAYVYYPAGFFSSWDYRPYKA